MSENITTYSGISQEEYEKRSAETVSVMGVPLAKYQDCTWCGRTLACRFSGFGYSQPCDQCKDTEKYELYIKEQKRKSDSTGGIDDVFKRKEIKGVWEGHGRLFYTNYKGDVIKDEPYRPLETGKAGWEK